ncbi:MAG TPA: ComF family protein [Ktedonobacteraceae bacterium]|nr:ComF family protein [Ktedonobacteraceae bacterium]
MSSYTGPLRTCIRALKYQGQKRLAGPLGTLLAQAYATYQLQADLIVPVPLHTERIKQRGYSQLLAKVCATQLHVPLETSLLTRVRPTAAQVNLKPSERQRNVANAFRCTSPSSIQMVKGKRIVLIDDVCTTGATLGACAAPLFAAGAQSVWGLVLARPL